MDLVVHRTVHAADGERLSIYTVTPRNERAGACGVVIMHGAGTGNKERNLPFAEDFAVYGHPVVALDFSGHGESSGELSDLSLRRRCDQAAAVIGEVFAPERPLILVGFSMSGQTVADLLELYGTRVTAVALCAPGIYGRDAWDVPFGAGFSELIRRPESWRDSRALDVYARFEGRALLVVPEHDAVIPDGVTELLRTALAARADFSALRLTGAGHQLGIWLAGQPRARREIVSTLLRPRPSSQDPGSGTRSAGIPVDLPSS
ncbi:alpha/beta fold hydrolase [Streptomyces jumonjinensis]|uniref:Alpha/beta fold hydrolase n=1 Tax=Streptomyces jumonjinensis TaxID=1945 RepID=A0A646KA72_STRJU|nr:alpha/beta fold hydrolase [Streptomyces jumonjinensis]